MNKSIYIFSGLGADERVFQRIDFSEFHVTFIKWVSPESNETIVHYASRLLEQIKTEKPVLIGLSFGGMMAIEVGKLIATEKIILISSAKTKNEIPFYFRLAGHLGLHRLLPIRLLKSSNIFTNWVFSVNTPFEKRLLKQILDDTDPDFLKWAFSKILCWKNITELENVIHIHGDSDRLLPIQLVNSELVIANGGHFMILSKSDELNRVLGKLLELYKTIEIVK